MQGASERQSRSFWGGFQCAYKREKQHHKRAQPHEPAIPTTSNAWDSRYGQTIKLETMKSWHQLNPQTLLATRSAMKPITHDSILDPLIMIRN